MAISIINNDDCCPNYYMRIRVKINKVNIISLRGLCLTVIYAFIIKITMTFIVASQI